MYLRHRDKPELRGTSEASGDDMYLRHSWLTAIQKPFKSG
jgi:hypothetical protein